MISEKILKFCAWCGVINMGTYFIGMLFAHFLPVPSPALTSAQVFDLYNGNTAGIRIGAVIMLASGCFLIPLIGLISSFLKRIEGDFPVMSYSQLIAGVLGILFFYLPAVLFFIMAFRPERSPEMLFMFNDFAWMFMIVAWPTFVFQNTAIAVAIFNDKRPRPYFPRWLAFFQLWTALLYTGSILGPFFKTGPFAWNGLFAFWIPAIVFTIWNFVMAIMLLKAIEQVKSEQALPA